MLGKNNQEFDFDAYKEEVAAAADPLVEAVTSFQPGKKSFDYKTAGDLRDSTTLFFNAAADTLNRHNFNTGEAEDSQDQAGLTAKAKEMGLDKIAASAGKTALDAKEQAGKKAAKLLSQAGDKAGKAQKAKNKVKVDKKLAGVTGNLGGTLKDVKLDKKLTGLTGTLTDVVKEAKLDKKLATVADSVTPLAANALDSAGTLAGGLVENVGGLLKDNNKKAAELVGGAGTALLAASDRAGMALKEVELEKKLSSANKALGEAHLPEKFFTAAGMLPGVTIKNPKKAAKQFRKQRAVALKAVNKQQAELSKYLTLKQKEARKYVKARQKDIESGKIRVPFYEPPKKGFPWGKTFGWLAMAGLVYGGLAYNNSRIWNAVPPLESKLPGESRYFRSRQGIVFYKEAGETGGNRPPVVFVHGIGAGNYSYEWLQNFGRISQDYKAYAFDLLGFGNSDKPPIKYTAEVYIKQLTEFLDEVVKQPAIVVASSLGASYAVQVAYRRPELIQKLVLSSPTGTNPQGGKPDVAIIPSFLYPLLRLPVIGKAIYSGVASHSSIRSFAQNQMFYDKNRVTDEMVEQYFISGHQSGAEFAPPSFFTGLLDAEIGQTLGKLEQPILMFFGKDSRITPMWEAEALHRQNPQARMETFDQARLLVHWEHADRFNRTALDFMSEPLSTAAQNQARSSARNGVGFGSTGTHQTHPEASSRGGIKDKITDKVQEITGEKPEALAGKVQQVAGQAAELLNDTAEQVKEKANKVASEATEKAQQAGNKVKTAGQAAKDKASEAAEAASTSAGKTFETIDKGVADTAGGDDSASSGPGYSASPETMSHYSQQAGETGQHEGSMEAATEYPGDHDLQKELREHRETFIGDAQTGGALVEDRDNNGVDDRRSEPLG